MRTLVIEGGLHLQGEVSIQGAKNAAQKILPATIVFPGKHLLRHVPRIEDTAALFTILRYLGADITYLDPHTVLVNTESIVPQELPPNMTALSTGTFLFAGALLSRFGAAKLWHPGGDRIGNRSVGWHLEAFRRLGATIHEEAGCYDIHATALRGAALAFPKPTANGAVNAVMVAARSQGSSVIENVAPEPEIENALAFLRACGARITWQGATSLQIEGVSHGNGGGVIDILPDRNDAATFLIGAVLGRGPVTLKTIRPDQLTPLFEALRQVGAIIETHTEGNDQVATVYCERLRPTSLHLTSQPYPGFSTDWGPLMQVLMTQLSGTSIFHETVFSHRFAHIGELLKMRASIRAWSLPGDKSLYHFAPTDAGDFHAIEIEGPTQLHGTMVHANDIRAGAALVLAGIIASGVTKVTGIEQIERGYENFVERLNRLGALIQPGRDETV